MTTQTFTWIPSPEGVTGLHYTDTHLIACASCLAIIINAEMEHDPECAFIAGIASAPNVL